MVLRQGLWPASHRAARPAGPEAQQRGRNEDCELRGELPGQGLGGGCGEVETLGAEAGAARDPGLRLARSGRRGDDWLRGHAGGTGPPRSWAWMHYSQTGDGSLRGARPGRGGGAPEARGLGTGQCLWTRSSERQGTAAPGLTRSLPRAPAQKGPGCDHGAVGPASQLSGGGTWGGQTDGDTFCFSGHLSVGCIMAELLQGKALFPGK